MGCWNETCAISHLPIVDGQETVGLFILEKNELLFYPFEGAYNDYGALENIVETPNTDYIFKVMTGDKKFKFDTSQDHYEKEIEEGRKSFEGLVKAVERGLVLRRTAALEDQASAPARLILFRKPVYEAALELAAKKRHPWKKGTVGDGIKRAQQEAREIADKIASGEMQTLGRSLIREKTEIRQCYIYHRDFGYFYRSEFDDYLERICSLQLLVTFFSYLRKDIDCVQMGRGSQESNYKFWKRVNKMMARQAQIDHKAWKKMCE